MAQHQSIDRWPTPDQAKNFADRLRAIATLDQQADTKDPAAAVDFLLQLADKYDRMTA